MLAKYQVAVIGALPEKYHSALVYDRPLLVLFITALTTFSITAGASVVLSMECKTFREERMTVNVALAFKNIVNSGASSICLEDLGTIGPDSGENSREGAIFQQLVPCSGGSAKQMSEYEGWPQTGGINGGAIGICPGLSEKFERLPDCPFPGKTLYYVQLEYKQCPNVPTQIGAAMGYSASAATIVVLLFIKLLRIKKVREQPLVDKGSLMRTLKADAEALATGKPIPKLNVQQNAVKGGSKDQKQGTAKVAPADSGPKVKERGAESRPKSPGEDAGEDEDADPAGEEDPWKLSSP